MGRFLQRWQFGLTIAVMAVTMRRHASSNHGYTPMNTERSTKSSSRRIFCLIAGLFLLSFSILLLSRSPASRRPATVTLGTNGQIRLGGVIPLENTTVRAVALDAAARLNGGKVAITVDTSTPFSNLVDVIDSMRKAGITSVTLHANPNSALQLPATNKP